jgi:hypothetical protein
MNQLNLPRPRQRTTSAQTLPVVNPSQVRQLPPPQPAPVWLKSLLTMQKGAMVLSGILLGLSSIVYGYTIQTQGTWRSQHRQWNRLESQGRQQSVIVENIKQKLAETAADEKSGLVAPTPEQMVFIPSAPQRPVKSVPLTQDQTTPVTKIPAGY